MKDIGSETESCADKIVQLDISIFNVLKEIFADKFSNVVERHTRSVKDNIRLIEDALVSNNATELEYAAHSIKGASAQFGTIELSKFAQKMEQFGKDGEIEKAKEIISAIKMAREEVESLMLKEL